MPWMNRDGINIYVSEDRVEAMVRMGYAAGAASVSSQQAQVAAIRAGLVPSIGVSPVSQATGVTQSQYAESARKNYMQVVSERQAVMQAELDAQKKIQDELAAAAMTDLDKQKLRAAEQRRQDVVQKALLAGAAASIAAMLGQKAADMLTSQGYGTDSNVNDVIDAAIHLGPERLGNPANRDIISMFVDGNIDIGRAGPPPVGGTQDSGIDPNLQAAFDLLNSMMSSGGGGGGGSGGPVYTPPDRRTVEDIVKDKVALLVGKKPDALIQRLADEYMKDHKLNWEGKTSRDPAQSVLEGIRQTAEYKNIHALRPDTVDESEWLTSQVAGVRALGVSAGQADERAITQATVGTSAARAAEAATIFQQQGQIRSTPAFFDKISQSVTSLARMVR